MKLGERLVFFLASKPNCISHTIPDFSRAINLGLREMMRQAQSKTNNVTDKAQNEFYTAMAIVLEGIIAYSNRLADHADELGRQQSDPILKEQLFEIATVNRRVPEHPAGTFRQALTTVWLCWMMA